MAKRRGQGEGSIYQRQDGRWVASITLENRKRKTIYGKTRREVQEKLIVALREKQQGMLATGPQQMLKSFLDDWLEKSHKHTIHVSTYTRYRIILDCHIIPALGHIALQKLTQMQVQSFYTQKLEEGLSASTVERIHAVLHCALSYAVKWGLVSRNICDTVTPPRVVKHEIKVLTKEQVHKLLNTAKGHRLEVLLTVAIATGMRKGELLALRWSDVDFEKKSLQVRRTVNRYKKVGFVESAPKTATSKRTIALPQFVVDALRQQRLNQDKLRLEAGEKWQENELVFPNIFGRVLEPVTLQDRFRKLLKSAGLPRIRFHDLRHSAATTLLSMGVNPKIVQEILGHSTIKMTLDIYSHVLPSIQRDAMDRLNDWFEE